jgi:GT2 family glycosyltransferase
MPAPQPTIVAIPVRNEEQHLKSCLDALSNQTHPANRIFLLLNNCTDASRRICEQAQTSRGTIQIMECQLNGAEASAGEARRRALDHALALCADGIILTTDADSVVPASWIADNLAEIAIGADCVCGMAVIDPRDTAATPRRLEFDDMRERLLLRLQDEIRALVDPDPFDPWPRHQQHSGASIAVSAAALRRAGGAPRIASGEDRALVARMALFDANIRHAPQIQVMVSGRAEGRAAGGMAETIARRRQAPDRLTDEMLEPTVDAYRRSLARLRLRAVRRGGAMPEDIAKDLIISPPTLRAALQDPWFGAAWETIQRASPILRRRRVAYVDLACETRQALALRDHLYAVMACQPWDTAGEGLRHAG